jgi:2-amino-4-hydroxy-6-hydroxymethyldihydropteridine diphosphokinase
VNAAVLAAVAWGSNLGDRHAAVASALARLAAEPGVRLVAGSRTRETEPVGGPPQGRYLNGVVVVETTLAPRDLLDALLRIEAAGGRVRAERDGPRTIDLDLLLHGDAVVDEPRLTLPHPRMQARRFVLEPLAEVLPAWRHPALQRTAAELLALLPAKAAACSA